MTVIVEALVRRCGGADQIAVEVEMSGHYGTEAISLAGFMLRRMSE